MYYKKIKTINKQGTIIKSTFLSVLLLFLLNIKGCGGAGMEGGHPKGTPGRLGENKQRNELIRKFEEQIGGWGSCTDKCFLKQLRADAEKTGAKKAKVGGVKSYLIPKYAVDEANGTVDENKSYFEGLMDVKILGNEDGRMKWKKAIRENPALELKFRQGVHGIFNEVAKVCLGSGKTFKRATGIYILYQYMKFVEEVRKTLEGLKKQESIDKDALKSELQEALTKLKKELEKVSPEGKGILLVIPVDVDDEVRFVDREGGMFKRKAKHVLSKAEADQFDEINSTIESMIEDFVGKL